MIVDNFRGTTTLNPPDTNDYVSTMESEVDDSVAVIFQEAVQAKNMHGIDNTLFCFYEGNDDFKFYPNKIESILYEKNIDKGIYSKGCGCRDNVIDICTKLALDSEGIINSSMFFVDRDFHKSSSLGERIYITPCYSIENLYAETKVLELFLQNHIRIGSRSIGKEFDDYRVLLHHFETKLNKVLNDLLLVNAWYSFQINNKIPKTREPKLYKLKELKSIKNKLGKEFKDITIEDLKSITPGFIEVNEEKLEIEKEYIKQDIIKNSRGKYVEEILVEIYSYILNESNEPRYLNISKRSISINIGMKNFKSTLIGQIITPHCLNNYIIGRIIEV
ncbi:DUF4435 domain-containing protein [Solibacillus sp. FSL K6-1126]|uniref:DUF4435 domain-containing protein n=1 Tax=Solibacillus sp. FSL K6-1126 TaxID=2921463 RepID=UPI0030F4BC35